MVMVGPSGSGKSVFSDGVDVVDNIKIVSTDEIREILLGDANDQSHGNKIFEFAYNLTRYYLYKGYNVVFDATNLIPSYRKRVLECAKGLDIYKVAYVMNTPKEVCLKRNSERFRKVPEEVIERQFKLFVNPTVEEGFDEVRQIDFDNERFTS